MANISPFDLLDALQATIEGVSDSGVVLIDPKFINLADATDSSDLYRLMASQNGGDPHGWLISWQEIPNQQQEDDCAKLITYGFAVLYIRPYVNDDTSNETSELKFKRTIWNVSEAINMDIDLGLGALVASSSGLISVGPFTIAPFGPNESIAHVAEFRLDFEVTSQY